MLRSGLSLACSLALAHASFLVPQQGLGVRSQSTMQQGVAASRPARTAQSAIAMGGQIIVTDGTDSFYGSRTVFQVLHEFAEYDKIVASSSSVADAKKMLLSRNARYSGLLDKLEITESPIAEAMAGSDTWLSVNADLTQAKAQIEAAKAAGVKRVLLLFTADGPEASAADIGALQASLETSGLAFSVVRTGKLVQAGTGGGLLCGEIGAECGDVPKEDIFRFVTEALTLDVADKRLVTIMPTKDDSQFRQMRRAGCDRREEAEALLKGVIKEKTQAEIDAELAKVEAKKKEETKTDIPEKETTEEELQMLIERARKKGEENRKRMAEEEAEKKRKREERIAYFKSTEPEEAPEDKKKDGDDTDKGKGEPPAGGAPKAGGDGDSKPDKPDEPPLALA